MHSKPITHNCFRFQPNLNNLTAHSCTHKKNITAAAGRCTYYNNEYI